MSKTYVVYPNASAAIARLAQLDAQLGYPNPATKTERYAEPIIHTDGRAAFVVEPSIFSPLTGANVSVPGLLTAEERADNVGGPARNKPELIGRDLATSMTEDAAREDGWFPGGGE